MVSLGWHTPEMPKYRVGGAESSQDITCDNLISRPTNCDKLAKRRDQLGA